MQQALATGKEVTAAAAAAEEEEEEEEEARSGGSCSWAATPCNQSDEATFVKKYAVGVA